MPRILLCSLADGPSAVAGSAFNHRCSRCQRRVMVSPSGQRRLTEFAGMEIVCTECCKSISEVPESIQLSAEGEEELKRELGQVISNPWRARN